MWSKRKNRIAVHDLDEINISEVEMRFRTYDEARERLLTTQFADAKPSGPPPQPLAGYDFGAWR